MQIKFLTLYHNFDNLESSLISAQKDLIFDWWSAITNKNIKFIPEARITFKDYSLQEFYDQDKAKKYIQKTYGHKDKNTKQYVYFWSGEKYPSLDAIYEALSKQKRFMELIIEVEDSLI